MTEYRSIKVKEETYNRLVERATYVTTMDDVISQLLKRKLVESHQK